MYELVNKKNGTSSTVQETKNEKRPCENAHEFIGSLRQEVEDIAA